MERTGCDGFWDEADSFSLPLPSGCLKEDRVKDASRRRKCANTTFPALLGNVHYEPRGLAILKLYGA